jgi:hypothetical protein
MSDIEESLANLEAAAYDLSEEVAKLRDTIDELTTSLDKAVRVAVANSGRRG